MSSWGFGKGQFTEIIGILSTSPRSSSCWEVDLKLDVDVDVEVGILPIELCFASLCKTFLNLSPISLSLSPGHRQGRILQGSWTTCCADRHLISCSNCTRGSAIRFQSRTTAMVVSPKTGDDFSISRRIKETECVHRLQI
uniref:Uncharacterized protein n=1 Tax=Opuntia streptacantha TaxID=393608 RepID=A0A7C9D9C1_OPUST